MKRSIPVATADMLHYTGLTWQQVADELNRRYDTNWQGTSVSEAVLRWHRGIRAKLAKLDGSLKR